ncbi:ATP phosphoribosyltransferase regulatory subunit [Bartonella apis]|uniref:ATP phosphoribosyltransferase regulatory subunit n=1 Tax=Bartonella apis TaxID=1686310 RepID=UPI00242BA6F3|nr:ATP phosphoribosyltransferase regulatory subunit [Bartonella apis]
MTGCEIKANAIKEFFGNNHLQIVSIPILQPAEPFLDMAGEDLRRRIFMTENENGDSLCLRPEFTIPVCIEHIKTGATTPRRYAYIGEVFRQSRSGENGFYQAGIEDLGDVDEANADARTLRDASALLEHISTNTDYTIVLGDQNVFASVLQELGLVPTWQKRLLRSFGNAKQLRDLLHILAEPKSEQSLPANLMKLVEAQDEAALTNYIEEEMLDAGISPSAGRSPTEIARRLLEKQLLSSVKLTKPVLEALEEFLAIRLPLDDAEDALFDFGKKYELVSDQFLMPFKARNRAFEAQGIDLESVQYDAAFGRPLDYYTGFVFEIRKNSGDVIIGGGRYNRLMTMLGADRPIPAVGFSVWLDRLTKDEKSTIGFQKGQGK